MKIEVSEDGPYYVSGGVPLVRIEIVTNEAGESVGWRETARLDVGKSYALCRCGLSHSKPLCDYSHLDGFDGTEVADHAAYLDLSTSIDGPQVRLRDARSLCAEARFCDRAGGLWNLVAECDDPQIRALVEEMAAQCPSGRYTVCDLTTDEHHEPIYEPSIAIIEDPSLGVSGPLWVRGGVPIFAADGSPYEVRNRVTLCRCGHSKNKPFCDGAHIEAGFKESDEG